MTIVSCKKEILELEPISEISGSKFYNTTEELELATLAIYDALQNLPLREFALTEMRSDNAKSKSREGDWAQFENFTVAPTNQAIGTYWSANYNVIFRANRVLGNLSAATDGALRAQFEGEAKFNRALAHFNLVRAYGDVPLLNVEIGTDESDYFDRDPKTTVLAAITQDLQEASTLLPAKNSDYDFGRATSGAAQGLLAKVYLLTKNYSAAESLLSNIIGGSAYSLKADYGDVFYSEGNDEIIFAIPYLNDDANESQDFSFEMTAGGVRAGLNYLTDDFIANIDTADTERIAITRNPSNLLEVGKYLTTSSNARQCGNDWIVLRLADVYLMHVEAILAGNPSTQDIAAIGSYNAIRARVGMSEIATDGSGEITLDMLLNERRYELAFENHRFYDLVRTGKAQAVLSSFATSEGYLFTNNDLLLPIPQAEINVSNGALIQNPGY